MAILYVALLSLVGVLGDYFLKLSGSGKHYIDYKWFIFGLLIYSSTAIGWFFVMKHIKLGTLGIVYATVTVISLAIVGVFFFKEQMNSYEITGLILGLISIFLLARFS